MALMLGVRLLVSTGLAGAAVGIAHQYTKATEEKFYNWAGKKFWCRSPDPAANSGETETLPSAPESDQLQPLVHNIVDGNLTVEQFEERDLAHSVNAVYVDGARELQPTRPNAIQGDLTAGPVNIDEVELTREAPDLVHASPALPAVQGESADDPPRSEVVNLCRETPDPAGAFPAVQGESATEPPTSEVVNLCGDAPDPTGVTDKPPPSEAVNQSLALEAPDPTCVTGVPFQPDAHPPDKPMPPDPPPVTGAWVAVNAWIAGKLSRKAPDPAGATGVPSQPAVQGEAEPTGSGAVNLSRQAPGQVGATGVPYHPVPRSEAVNVTCDCEAPDLAGAKDAPPDPDADPPFKGMPTDPPPAKGFLAVVKDWVTGLWVRAMKDPDLRYKILHISKTLLLVFVDYHCRRRLKTHNFWFEAYNKIFKFELSKLYAYF